MKSHNKYHNNNNSSTPANIAVAPSTTTTNNYVAPKTILQNPNRHPKPKVVQQETTVSGNNIIVTPMESNNNNIMSNPKTTTSTSASASAPSSPTSATPVVSANDAKVKFVAVDAVSSTTSEQQQHGTPQSESSGDCNKENESLVVENENMANQSSNCLESDSNILSNEDPQAAKNSKEKTPMCLVNELARFNKITHQYRLTGEKGPAHCKRFTVTLKLGDEEYSAEGFKIKKAQHLAAAEAIEKTKYKHPIPKVNRRTDENGVSRANITPTVELNALAMKLGQQTYYLFDPRQTPADAGGMHMPPQREAAMMCNSYAPRGGAPMPPHMMTAHSVNSRPLEPVYLRRNGGPGYAPGMHGPPPPPHMMAHQQQHRFGHRGMLKFPHQAPRYPMMHPGAGGPYAAPPPPTPCKITLIVGKQKFVGMGRTLQQAKHDAAARALQVLKTQAASQANEEMNESLDENDAKSPISQVHEIGIKRRMTVHFKVLREEGPAHMRNFITACIVGSIVTEGEGNGKKISKKRAADKMLEELNKLPPLSPTQESPVLRHKARTPRKGSATAGNANSTPNAKASERGERERERGERRKKPSTREKPAVDADNDAENPITKLLQIMQTRKEKEPAFDLVAKNGNETSRRREFIVEVSACGMVARGTGNTKKLAKRNAAQSLLETLNGGDSTCAVITADNDVPGDHISPSTLSTTNTTATAQSFKSAKDAKNSSANDSNGAIAKDVVPLTTTTAGQVPGILILRQKQKHASKKKDAPETPIKNTEAKSEVTTASPPTNKATTISATMETSNETSTTNTDAASGDAKSNSSSTTTNTTTTDTTTAKPSNNNNNTSISSTSSSNSTSGASVHMKEQLMYLSKLMEFEVNFSDYPKGNHNEFLTIVTLSTTPPQICHGVGTSSEESQNDAAKNALKILSELGLNSMAK